MTNKVFTACRDCKNCTNSDLAHFGRRTGRRTAMLMTVGASEVALATKRKCRQCGHQMSLHGQTSTLAPPTPSAFPPTPMVQQTNWYAPQPPPWPPQQPPTPQRQPSPPSSPPSPGWFARTSTRIQVFYTHPDPATRIHRRYITAIVLTVLLFMGSLGGFMDGDLSGGFGTLAAMLAALVWALWERKRQHTLADEVVAARAEDQHSSEDPDRRLYGDYPPPPEH